MNSVLEELGKKEIWEAFYTQRAESGHLSRQEIADLKNFVEQEEYSDISKKIIAGSYEFSIPRISKISKSGTSKKRVVYQYNREEVWILKLLCNLMYKYDGLFSDNCYSFRKSINAKTAVKDILAIKDLDHMYCLKADIHNYFNSIPSSRLLEMIKGKITDDEELVVLLEQILMTDMAYDPDKDILVKENRGAMAGMPLSSFFANLYLSDMDYFFSERSVAYFRYADDILIFANSMEKLIHYKKLLLDFVRFKELVINDDKFQLTVPGQPWEFLGFKYHKGFIDISDNTKKKAKAKIRRKAYSIYRWKNKKNASFEQAAHVFVRSMNRKFYDCCGTGDFSWSKWFFPLINTSNSLKELDDYLIEYIRFLDRGRHYKGNYRVSYAQIKDLGFKSLVNEYYKIG